MIKYEKIILNNGLNLIVHEDKSTPMVAVNLLYHVGARNEHKDKTGFAHLFEHLMFGGSVNIPDFDGPLQKAGGTNNAFTSSDITNYYEVLPANNLETALWLESDRMLNLDFSQKSLDIQKKVVSEEFKERCLNQPYGDVWHHLRKLCYKTHSYQWPVIGKNLEHIENFELNNVKDFFNKYYRPNNATLCISGGINTAKVVKQVKKWFGDIPSGNTVDDNIPEEIEQNDYRTIDVKGEVPLNAIYMAFKMPGRQGSNYYQIDFMSDLLAGGTSSRFYQNLVKEKQLFSNLDAYITGNIDTGLFVIEGKLSKEIEYNIAENAIWDEIEFLKTEQADSEEMTKVKHKIEASIEFSQNSILNRAMELCYFNMIDDIELINAELDAYVNVETDQIQSIANTYFDRTKACVLNYKSNLFSK